MKLLSDTSGKKIDLQNVVKSCIKSLLATLIVVLGAENEGRITLVWFYPACIQLFLMPEPVIRQWMLCEKLSGC